MVTVVTINIIFVKKIAKNQHFSTFFVILGTKDAKGKTSFYSHKLLWKIIQHSKINFSISDKSEAQLTGHKLV